MGLRYNDRNKIFHTRKENTLPKENYKFKKRQKEIAKKKKREEKLRRKQENKKDSPTEITADTPAEASDEFFPVPPTQEPAEDSKENPEV